MLAILEPRVLLQIFYLTASATILFVYLTPALNRRFLAYGARETEPASDKEEQESRSISPESVTAIDRLLDRVAAIRVPHNWFAHFYVVSTASSAFWAYQVLTRGFVYTYLASLAPDSEDPDPCVQVAGCWALLAMQGLRRLYECLRQPQGSSKMWVGHYAIGIAFYLATGIAIWIEGLPSLKAFNALGRGLAYTPSPPSPPSISDILANGVFWGAWADQHIIHQHLRSLKKYTLPTHPTFQWVITPHYTCECMIYLSLAFLSRPSGCYLNYTMTAAFIFVVVNLGISADGTKRWMRMKFGAANVAAKWRMIPWVW